MDGLIVVDKPKTWTSFDVVKKLRNMTNSTKAGHAGTLDPMATGVLLVFFGKSTKSVSGFMNGNKGYSGEFILGIETDTLDADGKISCKTKVENITERNIHDACKNFTGKIKQIPPMTSAIKINGKKLYELARKGIVIQREPRNVEIFDLEVLKVEHSENPKVNFTCSCSKGTYIRALVRDIGRQLGCGAHLSKLRRTYSHPFSESQAHTIEEIKTHVMEGNLDAIVLNPSDFQPNN